MAQGYGNGATGYPNQSKAAHQASAGLRPSGWSTGLFDCLSHASGRCIVTWFCPCCTYGRNVEIISGNGGSCGPCCGYCCAGTVFLPIAMYMGGQKRTQLRAKYNLQEDTCNDCVAHILFPCALCQESRELAARAQTTTGVPMNPGQSPHVQTMAA